MSSLLSRIYVKTRVYKVPFLSVVRIESPNTLTRKGSVETSPPWAQEGRHTCWGGGVGRTDEGTDTGTLGTLCSLYTVKTIPVLGMSHIADFLLMDYVAIV
jgi:hypothetical protein